jgi:hypothetical protein
MSPMLDLWLIFGLFFFAQTCAAKTTFTWVAGTTALNAARSYYPAVGVPVSTMQLLERNSAFWQGPATVLGGRKDAAVAPLGKDM